MKFGLSVLNMSHDEVFALTPFQFAQLYNGYVERERLDAIKRAELEAVIANANRRDEKQKTVDIQDILPWYEDYVAGREITQERQPEYVERRHIDFEKPQLERVRARLLEDKGHNPDEVKQDSKEWIEADKIARACITGGTGVVAEHGPGMQGFGYRKADPAEWGRPPWEDDKE